MNGYIICFCLLLVFAAPCWAESVVVQRPSVCWDASIYSAPEARNRTFEGLIVSRANVRYQALIRFDLAGVRNNRPVKDAAVMLFLSSQYHDSPLRVVAKTLNAEWSETEVTYDRRTSDRRWEEGDRDRGEIARFDISRGYGKGWIVLRSSKLTQLVDEWIRGKRDNHGLLSESAGILATGPSMKFFDSSEADLPDRHPKLVIDFDGSIDPAKHGFVSESEVLRVPLRERLDELASGAKSMDVDVVDQICSLRADLSSIDARQPKTVRKIEERLGELRAGILASVWSGKKVAAWIVSPWQDLSPTQLPRETSLDLRRRMLQGEYQEITLALTNLTHQPQTVTVRLDLPEGISPDSVEVRASYWIRLREKDALRGDKPTS